MSAAFFISSGRFRIVLSFRPENNEEKHCGFWEQGESVLDRVGSERRPGAAAVGVILILCGAAWIWVEVFEDRVVPKRWVAVEKGCIYRSGRLSPSLVRKTLKRHKIAVIVDLTQEELLDRDQQAERKAAEQLGIHLTRFPLV